MTGPQGSDYHPVDFTKLSRNKSLSRKSSNKDSEQDAEPRRTAPQVSDLLNSVRPPTGLRVFKSEPLDGQTWKAMRAKDAKSVSGRRKMKKRDIPIPIPQLKAGPADENSAKIKKGNQNVAHSPPHQQRQIVDLTMDPEGRYEETEQSCAPKPSDISSSSPNRIRPLTMSQAQWMDQLLIPPDILQQAQAVYFGENKPFPPTLKLWAHLKHFVFHRPAANLTSQIVAMVQAHIFRAIQEHAATISNTSPHPQAYSRSPSLLSHLPVSAQVDLGTSEGSNAIKIENGIAEQVQSLKSISSSSTAVVTPGLGRMGRRNGDSRQTVPVREKQTSLGVADDARTRAQIEELMRPDSLIPDLLPPDAPDTHPRLVKIWEPAIIGLPTTMHDHMSLPDTIVSILARYDLQARSVIEGFLDVTKTQHFFFLFKARERLLHSWSIEREGNIVTIGVERKTRTLRKHVDAETEACSSGQLDLSIQYEIVPPPSIKLVEGKPMQSAKIAADINSPSVPVSFADNSSPQSNLPKWVLTNLTLLPATPTLTKFLYNTPPTRGADDHTQIVHPAYSHLLNPNNELSPYRHALSIFARYMQHTIFTTGVIDSEIQVVWGHKCRFDSTLGRVRQLYRYALKGAQTQRAKRERGEYNRVPKLKGKDIGVEAGADDELENSADRGKVDDFGLSWGFRKYGDGEARQRSRNKDLDSDARYTKGLRAKGVSSRRIGSEGPPLKVQVEDGTRDKEAQGSVVHESGFGSEAEGLEEKRPFATGSTRSCKREMDVDDSEPAIKKVKREAENTSSEYSDDGDAD